MAEADLDGGSGLPEVCNAMLLKVSQVGWHGESSVTGSSSPQRPGFYGYLYMILYKLVP